MSQQQQQFGVVGLGKIGANLSLQALRTGMHVVGFDLQGPPQELTEAGLIAAREISEFRDKLATPRIIFLYVPAGRVVDNVLGDPLLAR